MTGPPDNSQSLHKPKYRWPWFVLAAILLGIALAILWLSREVERTRRLRDFNPRPTNASKPAAPPAGSLAM